MRTPGMKTHTLSRVRRADGGWRWIESINHSLFEDQNVRALVTNYRDVTERKLADERTAVLLEVSRIMSGTIDRDELLDRVQARVAALLPCEAVVTFYADQKDDVFRMVAHHGVPPALLRDAQQLVFRRGVPFGGRVSGGETLVINDVREQPWLPVDLYARFGIAAAVAAPLRVHGRELGAMVAFRRVAGAQFDADQVDLFGGIAQQLAVALESVELYQAQQEEAEVASALARVGRELIFSLDQPGLLDRLCRLTAEVLGCDCAHTFLWRRDEDVFVPVSSHGDTLETWEAIRALRIPRAVGVRLLARLAETEALRYDAASADELFAPYVAGTFGITAGLVIALRRGDEVIGVQSAGCRGGDRVFTSRHERIARGIAQLASMALHNARLLDELTQANQVKSDFVATMSHELRTPLHIILGYNALLLEGALGELSGEQGDALRRIDRNARELFDLVNAMLDLSRLEAGKLPVRPTDVDLAALVDELDSEIREFHLQKPTVEFEWRIAPGLPRLFTDPVKLKVVIKNLVRNALKFTERGRVAVSLRGQGRGLAIEVRDTGIGIAPEARAVIFEPFRQANSAIAREHGGAGLGLYIVRRLLETLGGTIELDSELGRGSTFRIWLPERCDPRPA
jgi:signal transduction histidine kinase